MTDISAPRWFRRLFAGAPHEPLFLTLDHRRPGYFGGRGALLRSASRAAANCGPELTNHRTGATAAALDISRTTVRRPITRASGDEFQSPRPLPERCSSSSGGPEFRGSRAGGEARRGFGPRQIRHDTGNLIERWRHKSFRGDTP